jgi:thiamine kinase-like enzyme
MLKTGNKYINKNISLLIKSVENDINIYKIKRLYGGLSNEIYHCQTSIGDLTIRLYDKTDSNFQQELNILQMMNGSPYVPKLYKALENCLILEYIEGTTLKLNKFKNSENLFKLAVCLKQLHCGTMSSNIASSSVTFTVKNVLMKHLQRYANVINLQGSVNQDALVNNIKMEIKNVINQLETCKSITSPFCHNDIHPGNVIVSSDLETIKFIDFGNAGNNFVMYDIANMFCELYGFDSESVLSTTEIPNILDQETIIKDFLKVYDSAISFNKEEFMFFVKLSHFYWSCWALVKYLNEIKPNDNYDYYTYALIRFAAYETNKKN